jgi:hypothetical protein
LILSTTSVWAGKAVENVTESEYFDFLSSGETIADLKNCSLDRELNQVDKNLGMCWN